MTDVSDPRNALDRLREMADLGELDRVCAEHGIRLLPDLGNHRIVKM